MIKAFFRKETLERKAQLGATITLIVATIIIFFTLTIFFYLSTAVAAFKFQKHADISLSYSNKEQALISLKAFLRTPVEVEIGGAKTTIPISGLIRINSGSYDSKITGEASKIFKPFGSCYFFKTENLQAGNQKYSKEVAIIILPSSPEKTIEVSLAVNSKCLENT